VKEFTTNRDAAYYFDRMLDGTDHLLMSEKNVPVTPVLDFATQKQEWALRFRDSSHSGGAMRDGTLRKARENRQHDMSLRSLRTRPSAYFAAGRGEAQFF